MSLLDLIAVTRLDPWLGAVAFLAAILALGASLHVTRLAARERRRLDEMRRDLQTFTEASVRMAESVEQVLRGGATEAPEAAVSSRRYLLMQARERMQNGESIDTLASRLRLCDDEKHLLAFLRDSSSSGRVHVA